MYIYNIYNRQKAVSAHFTSKLIMLCGMAQQYAIGYTFTMVNDFRRFLSRFSINNLCYEISRALLSSHVATAVEIYFKNIEYLKS